MTLLKINDKIINMDHVTVVQLKDKKSVWINFGTEKGAPEVGLSLEESAMLWDYLQKRSEDVMHPKR